MHSLSPFKSLRTRGNDVWQILIVIKKSFWPMQSLFQLSFISFDIPVVSLDSQEAYRIWFYHLYQFVYRNYYSITENSRNVSIKTLKMAENWKKKYEAVCTYTYVKMHYFSFESGYKHAWFRLDPSWICVPNFTRDFLG